MSTYVNGPQVDEGRLSSITRRLIAASEKRSMSTCKDHPWGDVLTINPVLRKRERVSIYGTPYWELASENERHKLANEELITWWSGFIQLEGLVSEYYMRVLNSGVFKNLPYVEEYMKHFVKEEIVHTIVFAKAIKYYGGEMYQVPDFLRTFYDDNAGTGEYPLMAVYLTMVIEWIADLYQRLDVDADYVHPLAKAVVREHWKEETRHIKWGQSMIVSLANTDPEFQLRAKEMTPVYLRQLIDQGVTNTECFERIGFEHKAFQDHEQLLESVLYSPHRQQLNVEMALPLIRYFVSAGIYDDVYRELWESQGFGEVINVVLRERGKKNG